MSHLENEAVGNKAKPFKFSESFLTTFQSVAKKFDEKMEDLHKVDSLINKSDEYGVCHCSYKMRYISPADVSSFISNLEKAMRNKLIKPNMADCDMFAVASAKKFIEGNNCIPFESTSIMGNDRHPILPKGATLGDLIFLIENDVFALIVYSQYELKKRAEVMLEDIKILEGLHFTANMRSFVNKIPDIMNKNSSGIMCDPLWSEFIVDYIERFILFACQLNLTTVLQMLSYAVPKVSYKTCEKEIPCEDSNEPADNNDGWDDDDEYFTQEAVDMKQNVQVFFLFTQGKTPVISKSIQLATKSEFSHISISFNPELTDMYSFGGGGIRKEDINSEYYKSLNVNVFGMYMSKENVAKMKEICNDFLNNKSKAKFDYPALIKKLLHIDKKNNAGYRQICTTFVNRLLTEVGTPLSEKNIPSPKEMREAVVAKTDQVFELYSGSTDDYSPHDAKLKLKKEGTTNKAKAFDEVVTECCLLKTNDFMITNKIPFNCNMRDIVVQDMHPEFKDTLSALKFIMNDDRSPIHFLVVKYFQEPVEDYDPMVVMKMFFGHSHHDLSRWNRESLMNENGMNTDVNWLDKITYGNNFLDGNYRRDRVGNEHAHPIMNTFESLYKTFGGCDFDCENDKLANNLIKVSRLMKAIIRLHSDHTINNWEMTRDILSVLGEIFTRNMLRLYYNNTIVINASDQMNDTMIPGYMYAEGFVLESFIMEDGEEKKQEKAPNPKVTADGANLNSTGQKLKGMIKKLGDWARDALSKAFPKWFEGGSQKAAMDWLNKEETKKTHDEIMKAMSETFKPNVTDFPNYNITADPSSVNVEEVVKTWTDGDKTIDDNAKIEIKKALLPKFGDNSGIVDSLSKKTGDDFKNSMKNAILYSKEEEIKPTEEKPLSPEKFDELRNDLIGMTAFSEAFRKLGDSMGKACTELDRRTKADDNASDADKKQAEKCKAVFDILTEVSTTCYTLETNLIIKTVWPTTYKVYTQIFEAYKQQKNKSESSNGTEQQNNNATNSTTENTNETK